MACAKSLLNFLGLLQRQASQAALTKFDDIHLKTDSSSQSSKL